MEQKCNSCTHHAWNSWRNSKEVGIAGNVRKRIKLAQYNTMKTQCKKNEGSAHHHWSTVRS